MSTRREIEAKIAQSMNIIEKQVEAMTRDINGMVARINKVESKAIAETNLKTAFEQNEKVDLYNWTYERTFENRRCFTTQGFILLGTKAYKGIKKVPNADVDPYYEFLPDVMWLTKEEFTIRRLKGQL